MHVRKEKKKKTHTHTHTHTHTLRPPAHTEKHSLTSSTEALVLEVAVNAQTLLGGDGADGVVHTLCRHQTVISHLLLHLALTVLGEVVLQTLTHTRVWNEKISIWNNLLQDIRHSATLSSFKSQLKTFLFSEYFS